MSARRSHGSLGDLISTLVFLGMALLAKSAMPKNTSVLIRSPNDP